MDFIKTLLAARPSSVQNLYWDNLTRLFVGIVPPDDTAADIVWAYGLAPDQINPNVPDPIDPAAAGLAFAQVVPSSGIDEFLDCIASGRPYIAIHRPSLLFGAVDVPVQQPPTQGPKVRAVLALAHAMLLNLRAKRIA